MVVNTILSNIPTPVITFGGSALCGFFIGALLKRAVKIVLIIVGAFLGVLFISIQYLSHKGYLGNAQIDWAHIGEDTAAWFQSTAAHFSPYGDFSFLGIEATSGLAAGILLGVVKG
jgi:uncharacterized membrane protein (Fun14 family)